MSGTVRVDLWKCCTGKGGGLVHSRMRQHIQLRIYLATGVQVSKAFDVILKVKRREAGSPRKQLRRAVFTSLTPRIKHVKSTVSGQL